MGEAKRRRGGCTCDPGPRATERAGGIMLPHESACPTQPALPQDKKTVMHILSGPIDEELQDAFRDRLKKVNDMRAATGHKPLTLHAFVVYVLAKNSLPIFDAEYAAAESADNLVKTPEQAAAEYRGRRTVTPPPIRVRA